VTGKKRLVKDNAMGKIVLWMQVSLDGYAEGPDGAFDWPVIGPEIQQYFVDELGGADAFLYGRKIYEMMASYWPIVEQIPSSVDVDVAYGKLWVPMPKLVFSKTLDRADWNTRVVGDGIAEEIAKLKADGKTAVVFGGIELASTFISLGLVDEYRLFVHPVVLGGGRKLFPGLDARANLKLVEARTFDSAVVHVHYVR
jgi:dihydrofolate reductase